MAAPEPHAAAAAVGPLRRRRQLQPRPLLGCENVDLVASGTVGAGVAAAAGGAVGSGGAVAGSVAIGSGTRWAPPQVTAGVGCCLYYCCYLCLCFAFGAAVAVVAVAVVLWSMVIVCSRLLVAGAQGQKVAAAGGGGEVRGAGAGADCGLSGARRQVPNWTSLAGRRRR